MNLLDALAGVAATVGDASLLGAVIAVLDALATAAIIAVAAVIGLAATTNGTATTCVAATVGASVNLSTTNFIQVPSEGDTKRKRTILKYTPVIDVSASSFKRRDTVFKVYKNIVGNRRLRLEETPPTAEVLVDQFWYLPLVEKLVLSSNKYCSNRQLQHPGLHVWTRKKDSAPFTVSIMYQFISILYYFGVV